MLVAATLYHFKINGNDKINGHRSACILYCSCGFSGIIRQTIAEKICKTRAKGTTAGK
jgi:hypothetical protein